MGMTGSNANGPTILKYSAYSESLKSFTARYCNSYNQIEQMLKSITVPPARVEMRYKRDQSKYYYIILDAFKTIKPHTNAMNAKAEKNGTSSSLGRHPIS